MNSKTILPSLDQDLEPRRKVDLKALKPAYINDEEIAENSRKIGADWGADTKLEPVLAKPKVLLASLRIEVPDYLDRELAIKAVHQRVTKQYLVMKALQSAGYRLDDSDLYEDKRKAKKNDTR
jgi:hypothetical protein